MIITLKYAGVCKECGKELPQGTRAKWYRNGVVYCLEGHNNHSQEASQESRFPTWGDKVRVKIDHYGRSPKGIKLCQSSAEFLKKYHGWKDSSYGLSLTSRASYDYCEPPKGLDSWPRGKDIIFSVTLPTLAEAQEATKGITARHYESTSGKGVIYSDVILPSPEGFPWQISKRSDGTFFLSDPYWAKVEGQKYFSLEFQETVKEGISNE